MKMKTQMDEGIIRQTNHKGFSLVELIVVVAIMAVLVGVLAPQYLRYVEKTRLQKDNSALAEIAEAIKIAVASEEVYNELSADSLHIMATRDANNNQVLTFANANNPTQHSAMIKELENTIGTSFTTQSSTYQKQSSNLTLYVTLNNGTVEVTIINWSDSPDREYVISKIL